MEVKSGTIFNYYRRVSTLLHFHAFGICHYPGRELNKNLCLEVFLQSQESVLDFSTSILREQVWGLRFLFGC